MRRVLLPILMAALAACDMPPPTAPETAARPPARQVDAPTITSPSKKSQSAALFYRRIEDRLLTEGLLRRDGGGPDAPYGTAELTRNFERIALFSEYVQVNGRYVAQQARAPLRRWERPVRIQLHFGESVDQATRDADATRVRSYVARLRRVSGHPISVVNSGGNYHVFVVSLDEQAKLGPEISRVEPGLSRSTIREIISLPESTYCAVYASSASSRPNAYVSAIALVRSEHPDLMRLSCYHEEIAQGLGLANDSPAARPSIFNDDEEFALLTRHDELLLKILYDRRLNVGMTADRARPLVREIASELVGGPS